MTSFELNGVQVEASSDHAHLLAALRDELGVTSPKDGCAPSGQCGCCTVLVDGKARISCQTSMERTEGASITTLEGLPDGERERYATAFAAHGALQCGFCTPGVVMSAVDLVNRNQNPSEAEIREWLEGNICRCTGYHNIVKAVKAAAATTRGK